MNITVITNLKITESDIKEIAALEKEYFSQPWSETSIKESLKNNTEFFVAKDSCGAVLGYMGLNHILDEGYVTSIAVRKDKRRKGIAENLINSAFLYALNNSISFISLEVRESNKGALALYEKLGFIKEGFRKNFYIKPCENAIILTRRFNQ